MEPIIYSNCSDYLFVMPRKGNLAKALEKGTVGATRWGGGDYVPFADPYYDAEDVLKKAAEGLIAIAEFYPFNWPLEWKCGDLPPLGEEPPYPPLYAEARLLRPVLRLVERHLPTVRRCMPSFAPLYEAYIIVYRMGIQVSRGAGLFTTVTGIGYEGGNPVGDGRGLMALVEEGRYCKVEFSFSSLEELPRRVGKRVRKLIALCAAGRG